jgi:hypothetical protein
MPTAGGFVPYPPASPDGDDEAVGGMSMAAVRHPNVSAPPNRILRSGLTVLAVGAAAGVAVLMQVRSLHGLFWSTPLLFVSSAVVGPIGAYLGGWWLGRYVAGTESRRWLTVTGTVLTLPGGLLGLFSLMGAWAIAGTGF